jgi:tyrosinase
VSEPISFSLNRTSHWLTGDFNLEPIFFLHHTQVDRLWWQWQQNRAEINSLEADEKLSDAVLEMSGLMEELNQSDMMTTESPVLCYRY